ncbi:Alkylated DNA repair protein alkB 8 [Portunus trituberculatus]|uniref:Alkylated DNA repair protein alkB 8 n=1 Tax=Portunus trituberculatus TaxID=210409 RepID=A0A5B7HPM0_PORTR|nr:Alkylated DNA repair protein alkB 8 [Portunus trituberculatus]
MSPEESRKEREARSLALERAYVHDVYDQISVHFSSGRHRVWPRVRQFLLDLEPGSFVADDEEEEEEEEEAKEEEEEEKDEKEEVMFCFNSVLSYFL